MEPVGVVAAIVPWNAPLNLSALKIAPALAAGCSVILKVAPSTPLDALIFAECLYAAGLPAGVVSRSEEHTATLQSLMRISYAVFRLKTHTNTKIGFIISDEILYKNL